MGHLRGTANPIQQFIFSSYFHGHKLSNVIHYLLTYNNLNNDRNEPFVYFQKEQMISRF